MKHRKTCPNCNQVYPPGYWEAKERLKGIRVSRALRAAKARGEHIGRKKKYDDTVIKKLRKKGLSIRAIAKELGCSPWTVQTGLKT